MKPTVHQPRPRARNPSLATVLLLLTTLLLPFAILVFATGFFPHKAFLPGVARYNYCTSPADVNSDLGEHEGGASAPAPAPFNRLIFMVVDALRSDFVYGAGSGFAFLQGLINDGAALPFTAHAAPPTITMPRIKALTTGGVPSFLDVILNFGGGGGGDGEGEAGLAGQDTWVGQMKNEMRMKMEMEGRGEGREIGRGEQESEEHGEEQGKVIMYGDDTWLRLFPRTFARADGTSSFFVSDFTDVDANVTRHVPGELRRDDWTAMVLHYLGLDHIGHKAGPRSPNMVPKQREMDDIVRMIYNAMEEEEHLHKTLLVLCGDHGMNDGGNHGGSAPGETSPALVFVSPKFKAISKGRICPTEPKREYEYYEVVEQSDVVPTLAGLLGFPVPLNNLGVFIEELLPLWDNDSDRKKLVSENALQMLNIVRATFPHVDFDTAPEGEECEIALDVAADLRCKFWHAKGVMDVAEGGNVPHDQYDEKVIDSSRSQLGPVLEFCRQAQTVMSSTASNYDLYRMTIGISIALLASTLALTCLLLMESSLRDFASANAGLLTVTAAYAVMMFASSYVEEEHHFWYWSTTSWLSYLFFSKAKHASLRQSSAPILCLLLHRVLRRWNQTGQKHAGAPDIAHTFLPAHPIVLWLLVIATYINLTYKISRNQRNSEQASLSRLLAPLLCAIGLMFKIAFTRLDAPELLRGIWGLDRIGALVEDVFGLVWAARLVFLGIAIATAVSVAEERQRTRAVTGLRDEEEDEATLAHRFHDLLTLFLITQTRVTNIPLFLIFDIQLHLLRSLTLSPPSTTLLTLLLAQSSFFAFGGSNAISSIDLSNAYNGISGYNVLAVGALLFVSNWAGSIYWSSAGTLLLLEARRKQVSASGEKEQSQARGWVQEERQRLLNGHLDPAAVKSTSSAALRQAPKESLFAAHFARLTLFTAVSALAVMLACAVLRTHLFIWTVFSPKYLFMMAWAMGVHLGVWGLLGGAVWVMGGGA